MEKMRQIPLGGLEPDENIGEEAAHAVAEEETALSERERIEKEKERMGFISYEKRKKQKEEGPGRKAALALLNKLRAEKEEGEVKKETLF